MKLDRVLVAAWLAALALVAISGAALGAHYAPSAALAHDSVRMLQQEVPGGAFLRALHVLSAHASIALALVALLAHVFRGVTDPVRAAALRTWLGLLLFVIVLGVTGEFLPLDEQAWFATQVRVGVAAQAPLAGTVVADALRGGSELGEPTLMRFWFAHASLLPLLLVLFVALRWRGLNWAGLAPLAAAAGGALLLLGALWYRVPVGVVAEPGDSGFEPVPEWHMLWLNQLLHLASGGFEILATAVIPALLVGALVVWPQVEARLGLARARLLAAVVLLGLGALTVRGLLHEPATKQSLDYPLGALTADERRGYLAVRRHKCLDCHAYGDVGETDFDAPYLHELDQPVDVLADILADPEGTIGSEDMPAYAEVPLEERRAIGIYLRWLLQHPPAKTR